MDSNFNFTVSSLRQKLIVGPVTIPYFTMHPRRGRKPSFAVHDPTVLNALAILSLVEHEEKRAVFLYPPRDKSSTNEDILPRHEQVLERTWFSLAGLQDFNEPSDVVCPSCESEFYVWGIGFLGIVDLDNCVVIKLLSNV